MNNSSNAAMSSTLHCENCGADWDIEVLPDSTQLIHCHYCTGKCLHCQCRLEQAGYNNDELALRHYPADSGELFMNPKLHGGVAIIMVVVALTAMPSLACCSARLLLPLP